MRNFTLPDGEKLELWEDNTEYKCTLHVAKNNPDASDENDGSKEKPFKTIQKAADIADAGDLVLIHEGVYHETVRPLGCGKSATEMLCFKGEEHEKIVVTGAETLNGPYIESEGWKRSHSLKKDNKFTDPKANVYMARLPRGAFVGVNPFAMINGPFIPWYASDVPCMFKAKEPAQQKIVAMRRGMIFCDGKRLTQVANYFEVGEKPGSFFVEDDGLTVHIRLSEDDDPCSHLIEFTAREQCFCPEEKYSSHIKIENITFCKAGNGFPPPQRGAVSTNCGHHFIIANCVVEDVNGVGIDIGFQCPARYSNAPRGFQIVSNCEVNRCGICGLSGVPGSSDVHYIEMQQPTIIVIDNKFHDNCWHDFEEMMENSAIKLHHMRNSLVLGNYINKTSYGCGIWTDASCENLAIRENIVLDTHNNYGGIFVEASHDNLEVSNNIILNSICHGDSGGNGIYSHNCDDILNVRNIILGCEQYAILHKYGDTNRINMGRGNTGYGVKFYENITGSCKYALMQPTEKGDADRNICGAFSEDGYLKVGLPPLHLDMKAWRKFMGWDKNGLMTEIEYSLNTDASKLKLSIKVGDESVDYAIELHAPLANQINKLMVILSSKIKNLRI